MVYNKLFRKLEGYTLKPTKFKRFLYWFLAPYFMILERRCEKGIWDNLIVKELITNDVVFEWLDNNDEYQDWLRDREEDKDLGSIDRAYREWRYRNE